MKYQRQIPIKIETNGIEISVFNHGNKWYAAEHWSGNIITISKSLPDLMKQIGEWFEEV